MRRKNRLPKFYIFLILFIAVFVVAVELAMRYLSDYLADYESAQPKYVAEEIFNRYYKSMDFDALITLSGIEIPEFESKESLVQYLHSLYDGCEVTYHSGISDDKKDETDVKIQRYEVQFGESAVAGFSIKTGAKKTKNGFDVYEPYQFTLRIAPEKSVRVTAPSNYTVYINGKKVEPQYIIESDIQTESCKHMPEGVSGITYCTYQVDDLYFDPAVKVLNPEGKESALSYNEEKKTYTADIVYSDSLKEQYEETVLTAMKKYAAYMSNDERFSNIKAYFDPASTLYDNIRTSETYFVIDHSGYHFIDVSASEFYAYDENTFSCRVSFTQVLTKKGKPDYKDSIDKTIYLRKVGDKFLIYDWYDH